MDSQSQSNVKSPQDAGRDAAAGSALSEERILQVLNNVSEEYVDLGQTDFATKKELCEAVLYQNREHNKEVSRLRRALMEGGLALLKAATGAQNDQTLARGAENL